MSKYTPEQVQKVRDISILRSMGYNETGRTFNIQCPFPDHNDSNPSCSMFPDNGYKCYGCDKRGRNFIDFLQDMGYSWKEIMEEYATDSENV